MFETNQVSKQFEIIDWRLAQSEDERIAIDSVAKAIDPNAKISALSSNMLSSVNAIGLLRKKIKFLVAMFKNEKKVSENPAFSRRLNQICNEISVLEKQETPNEFYSDAATLNMLSTATKGFEALQTLLNEVKMVEPNSRKRGVFGEGMIHDMRGGNFAM